MERPHSRVAVLIDAENMPGALATDILSDAGVHGPTVARRAYGDFAAGRGREWLSAAPPNAIDLVQVSSPAKGKNSSDIRMTIDAVELLAADRADVFCLVSSDGDFTPLAIHLRGAGKRVIGLGGQQASASFRQSCDTFVVVCAKTKASPPSVATPQPRSIPKGSDLQGLISLVQATIKTLGETGEKGWVSLSQLGVALRAAEPRFAAKRSGLGPLKKILLREPSLELGDTGTFVRIRPGIAILSG